MNIVLFIILSVGIICSIIHTIISAFNGNFTEATYWIVLVAVDLYIIEKIFD